MNSIKLSPEAVKAIKEHDIKQYRMTAAERTAQIRQNRAMRNLPYALISLGCATGVIVLTVVAFTII